MDKHTLAACLNGREYPLTIGQGEIDAAKEAGLVIVYGASDDLMEFDGVICEEAGVVGGSEVTIDKFGVLPHWGQFREETEDEDSFKEYFERKKNIRIIKAIWDRDGYSWQYETDIPHASFDIMEDGEKYCRGIVFGLKDL